MDFYRYTTLYHLDHLLGNKSIGVGLFIISFLFIFSTNLVGLMITIISALAILFSLYMLIVLSRYRKTTWIIGFFIVMAISFLPFFLMSGDNPFLVVLKFAPLLFFVLYCMMLKYKVGEWLLEMEFENQI